MKRRSERQGWSSNPTAPHSYMAGMLGAQDPEFPASRNDIDLLLGLVDCLDGEGVQASFGGCTVPKVLLVLMLFNGQAWDGARCFPNIIEF